MLNKFKNSLGFFNLAIIIILIVGTLLRLGFLSKFPPSPYWEEVALGYDAYSIVETGKDHHGNAWPIAAFESFGDWKPSAYFYALAPFVKLFGLKVWVLRLPAALAGILIIYFSFKISQFLFNKKIALLTAILVSISPWAILFSRAAWEVNLATALLCGGIYFGLKFFQAQVSHPQINQTFYIYHLLFLVLAMYTYHGARITAPLIGLWFFIKLIKEKIFLKKIKSFGLILLFVACLTLPIFLSLNKPEFKIRFAQTNIFSDLNLIKQSNAARKMRGNGLYARLFYHRYWYFAKAVSINFIKHFNLDFLFISGDGNPRHSIQLIGQLYHIELIFFLMGIFYLGANFKKIKPNKAAFLIFCLFAAILPASMTKTTPHALRILPAMPIFIILIALGINYAWQLWQKFCTQTRQKKIKKQTLVYLFWPILAIIYFVEFAFFIRTYTKIYPHQYSQSWQYGYQQMIAQVNSLQKQYPDYPIYITREQGRPAMYYWFFSKTDPKKVQAQAKTAKKDQGEFLEFDNIKFINSAGEINNTPAIVAASKKALTHYFKNYPIDKIKFSTDINNLAGETVWQIVVIE